jgi:hypothetical protein
VPVLLKRSRPDSIEKAQGFTGDAAGAVSGLGSAAYAALPRQTMMATSADVSLCIAFPPVVNPTVPNGTICLQI